VVRPEVDLFKLYLDCIGESEAPIHYHRWCMLSLLGTMLGRNFYLPFGNNKILPNQYILLVGDPGSRKSSAIKAAKAAMKLTGYSTFSAEKTTKEKFMLDLEESAILSTKEMPTIESIDVFKSLNLSDILGGEVEDANSNSNSNSNLYATPRECFVCADEFTDFIGMGQVEFISWLSTLWDWDDPDTPYRQRLKNSKSVSIYQPTLNILGGVTTTHIKLVFPQELIGQGAMSRLLFVYGESTGIKITIPQEAQQKARAAWKERWLEIKATVVGKATIEQEAYDALDHIYKTWKDLPDGRFKHYSTRRFTHLLKVCLICAASRCSTSVTLHDVILANTLLSFIEHDMPKALGEFGKAKNSDAMQAIMTKLYSSDEPVAFESLWKLVMRDLDKREALVEIISGLQLAGKAQILKDGRILVIRNPVDTNAKYVDYSLLIEQRK
jgi:phosphoribosyl-dephospho-CoA transferase